MLYVKANYHLHNHSMTDHEIYISKPLNISNKNKKFSHV